MTIRMGILVLLALITVLTDCGGDGGNGGGSAIPSPYRRPTDVSLFPESSPSPPSSPARVTGRQLDREGRCGRKLDHQHRAYTAPGMKGSTCSASQADKPKLQRQQSRLQARLLNQRRARTRASHSPLRQCYLGVQGSGGAITRAASIRPKHDRIVPRAATSVQD
jgi:hypothetical protein